jgi:5'-3' exonuclease
MALNTLRSINVKFRNEWGDLVIAVDSIRYWRKEFFPQYKAARRKARAKSDMDWPAIFACMNNIKSELQEFFPYKYIEIEGAEADDIIATICQNVDEKILIVSGDKDFKQLQTNSNVKQYDPVNKKWIKTSSPKSFLHEHILKGDAGDGIPNVMSPDNTFVLGERQKRLTKKYIAMFDGEEKDIPFEILDNYYRNKALIDLSEIPADISLKIMKEYDKENSKDKSQLFDYFMQHKLKNLMESINDF